MCTMVFVRTIRTIYMWKSTKTYACPNSNEPTLEPHRQFLYWTRTYKVMLNALTRYQIVHAEASKCHIKNVTRTSDFLPHLRLNTDNWPHRFVLKIAFNMSAKSVLFALWFSYMWYMMKMTPGLSGNIQWEHSSVRIFTMHVTHIVSD